MRVNIYGKTSKLKPAELSVCEQCVSEIYLPTINRACTGPYVRTNLEESLMETILSSQFSYQCTVCDMNELQRFINIPMGS